MPRIEYGAMLIAGMLAACEAPSSQSTKAQGADMAIDDRTPSDTYCVQGDLSVSEDRTSEELWSLYRHYALCDYQPTVARAALEILVDRGDTEAMVELGLDHLSTGGDRDQAERLLRTAAAAGNSRAAESLRTEGFIR